MVKSKAELLQEELLVEELKDAASIGNVSVVSIKDGYFSQIKIDHLTRKFQVFNKNIKAKSSHYKMIELKWKKWYGDTIRNIS